MVQSERYVSKWASDWALTLVTMGIEVFHESLLHPILTSAAYLIQRSLLTASSLLDKPSLHLSCGSSCGNISKPWSPAGPSSNV